MLPSQCFGTRAERFVVPPKFKRQSLSFSSSCCGEGAAGVSASAPPLSFPQALPEILSAMYFSLYGRR